MISLARILRDGTVRARRVVFFYERGVRLLYSTAPLGCGRYCARRGLAWRRLQDARWGCSRLVEVGIIARALRFLLGGRSKRRPAETRVLAVARISGWARPRGVDRHIPLPGITGGFAAGGYPAV